MTERIAPVAVDAMGGDNAPGAIVQGAINAARKGRPVILVGPEARVREEIARHRAGAHLRTLFIDEGFGTQDEDGRNKLVEAITAIQEDFDLVLVITHIDELRDSFPVHVVVEKTPNGSRIAVR